MFKASNHLEDRKMLARGQGRRGCAVVLKLLDRTILVDASWCTSCSRYEGEGG